MNQRIIIGITGASGSLYARKMLQILITVPVELHIVISEMGWKVLTHELGVIRDVDFPEFVQALTGNTPPAASVTIHDNHDLFAPVASGSFQRSGMVIIPCSMNTLSSVATGNSHDLICRAADVTLKERRPLILVVRETPLNLIHLKNMTAVTEAGAMVMPASPGFYHHPSTVEALVEQMVGRILDQLDIEVPDMVRWGDR